MIRLLLLLPLSSVLLFGCKPAEVDDSGSDDSIGDDSGGSDSDSGDDSDPVQEDIAIEGAWMDNWGGSHSIDNALWSSSGATYAISSFSNEGAYAIAQNGAENDWNPGLWSRFDWTWDSSGELHYCQTAFAAASEEEALATAAADASDLATGCGGFGWTTLRAPFALVGSWDDAWGGSHRIDPFQWASGSSLFLVAEVDDAASWLVAQNASTNSWNPDLWSRFDWMSSGGRQYYCQSAYAAASEAEAKAAAADAGDLLGGCGGFSWSEIRPSLSVGGEWIDNWGGSHTINAFKWVSGTSTFAITQSDDASGWAVAQNGASNEWSPGLWSRFDWTRDAEGGLWYCQTAYAAESEAAALATSAADATSPATGGCSGFSWTQLVAVTP